MPLVARWPGVIEPNTVNEDLVSNVDFAPTFLECAGVDAPKDMQGRSMMPVLKGKHPTDWRKTFYYEYFEYPAGTSVYPHYGVCTKKHKLIHYLYNDEIDAWELFDLEKDPHELHSVYDDPAYAGTVEELKVELARLRKELKVPV